MGPEPDDVEYLRARLSGIRYARGFVFTPEGALAALARLEADRRHLAERVRGACAKVADAHKAHRAADDIRALDVGPLLGGGNG